MNVTWQWLGGWVDADAGGGTGAWGSGGTAGRAGRPQRGGTVAAVSSGVLKAFNRWVETVSCFSPSCSLKKWVLRSNTLKGPV